MLCDLLLCCGMCCGGLWWFGYERGDDERKEGKEMKVRDEGDGREGMEMMRGKGRRG